jgi:GrpB-like predicted nucleotidyltransferase (UPF0157 family)
VTDLVRFSRAPEVFAKADRLYAEVAPRIAAVLPAADIHHVGSTAVPESLTKGDLDIVVRVSVNDFAEAEAVLESMFARNTGSFRSDEFAAFLDSSTDPELGVQLVVAGSKVDHFLQWRALLERDPNLRREYDELKRRFDGKSMDAYREAKAQFIAERLGGLTPGCSV